ncbi:MAG TPA: phosphonate C-P lyase system protein PhnH [Candidatus Methylomirabilis sp.]|nr:phosphonate C-P lyase system protein PhnH [Candidatus Methylomirabilis sp.]
MTVMAGLEQPVLDTQRIFRGALDAMSHPGRVVSVPPPLEIPEPLQPATACLCLTLVDGDTPVWLDAAARRPEVIEYLRFHCGCPIVTDPVGSRFAVVADPGAMPPLEAFDQGSDEYPDRSATLIVQVEALGAGVEARLTGPGIDIETRLAVWRLPRTFWPSVRQNHARFPRGIDLILTSGLSMVALPRTTRVDD